MATRRTLRESFAAPAPAGGQLRVEDGVIYGVRVLGPVSKNTYGVPGVDATEYAPSAHQDAVRLIEGRQVCTNHQFDKSRRGRLVDEVFGKLGNLRTVVESDGPVTYGDLPYLESHPMAGRVIEDVKRGLGVFGLSIDAIANGERIDKNRKRLVIERLATVDTVDLVFRPATNRNLWESEEDPPVKTTVRKLLEGHAARRANEPNRAKWIRRLVEDDTYAVPMSAEVDEIEGDPDAAIDDAFAAAIAAIVKAEGTSDEKLKKIEALLDAQAAIDGEGDAPDPDAPAGESTPDPEKKESVQPDAAARELAGLKAAMQLCESEQYTATPAILSALAKLETDADRRTLIAPLKLAKPAGASGTTPRSASAGRRTTEQEIPTDDKAKLAAFLRT